MPQFKDTWGGQLGMAVAQNAGTGFLGGLMGQLFAKSNDRRQIRQQQKLQDMQIAGTKQLTDYNYQKELDMWKATSYPGQIEMMKQAGLNPALLYGKGGGGGTTIGTPAGAIGMATAQQNPGEATAGMGMMMQNQMIAAQTDLIKAQTEKTRAETTKTSGVDTQLANTQIASITQGINNQKAVEQLTKVQTDLNNIQKNVQGATIEQQIDYIVQQARQMTGLASQALTQANLDTNSRQTRENTIKAEYIKVLLTNTLIKAQTVHTNQSTEQIKTNMNLMEQQMTTLAEELMINWDRLGEEKARTMIMRAFQEHNTDPTTDVLRSLTNGIGSIIPMGAGRIMEQQPKRNPIGYR